MILYNRRYLGRCLFYTAVSIGIPAEVYAQPSEEDFILYLDEVCDSDDIDIELFFLCQSLFPPAGQSQPSGPPGPPPPPPPPPIIGAGIQAAQSRNANSAATQQRTPVFERMDEIKTETDSSLGLSRWGWFGSLSTGEGKRHASPFEQGYISQISGLVSGIDYRFSDQLVSGIALGYLRTDTKFKDNVGRLDIESQSLTLFATTNPYKNSYLDGYIGWTKQDLDTKRRLDIGLIDEQISGKTDARQMIAGFASGYQWYKGRWNISADVKTDFVATKIDAYSDDANTGSSGFALEFSSQNTRSLTGALGAQISYTKSLDVGVLNPYARVFYVREFEDDGREINSQLELAPDLTFVETTDTPDRNYYILGAGTTYVLPRGLQIFANFETVSDHQHISKWNLSSGFRLEL